ncbi:hypothetical protein RI367_007177 [Sorochytrium milnesiophthora]
MPNATLVGNVTVFDGQVYGSVRLVNHYELRHLAVPSPVVQLPVTNAPVTIRFNIEKGRVGGADPWGQRIITASLSVGHNETTLGQVEMMVDQQLRVRTAHTILNFDVRREMLQTTVVSSVYGKATHQDMRSTTVDVESYTGWRVPTESELLKVEIGIDKLWY